MICEVQPEGLESGSQVRNTQCSYFKVYVYFTKKPMQPHSLSIFLGEMTFFFPLLFMESSMKMEPLTGGSLWHVSF